MGSEDVIKKEFQTKINVFDEYQKLSDGMKIFKVGSCETVIRFAEKHKGLGLEVPQRVIDYDKEYSKTI